MRYRVRHTTSYAYSDPVVLCQNQARLVPQTLPWQQRHDFSLEILPLPAVRHSWIDAFGNEVWYFSVEEPTHVLEVTSTSLVERTPTLLPAPETSPPWEQVRDAVASGVQLNDRLAAQFRFESPFIVELPEARDFALESFTPGRPLLVAALDLTRRIFEEFDYSPAVTAVSTPTREVFATRRGVCQDFAHLQITCLRTLGLPARYVSGYLLTEPPPGTPKLIGADASHAWLAIYCPGWGWIDLDPTNNVVPQEKHVTIGWGRDYGDVCPIKGVFTGGGRQAMSVSVDVTPVEPDEPLFPA